MTEVSVPEGARDGDYLRIDGRPYRIVDNQAIPLHPSVDVEALQQSSDTPPAPSPDPIAEMDELVEQKVEEAVTPPVEMQPTADPPFEQTQPLPEDLDSMTAAQLRAYAKHNRIDISSTRRRDDIIAAIRESAAPPTEEE